MDLDQLQQEANRLGLKLDVDRAFRALSTDFPKGRYDNPDVPTVPAATEADRIAALRQEAPWFWKDYKPNHPSLQPETIARYIAALAKIPPVWTRPEFCAVLGLSPQSGHLDVVINWLVVHGYVERLRKSWSNSHDGHMKYRTLHPED